MHWTDTCLICRRWPNSEKPTTTWLLMMLLLLLLPESHRCQQTPQSPSSQLVVIRSNRTNASETPDNIEISFVLNKEKISLPLQRNQNIRSNISVVLGRNGSLVNHTADQSKKYAYYFNQSTSASVLVKTETDSAGAVSYRYTGVFEVRGETYSIEPDTTSARRRRRRRRRGSERGLERMLRRRRGSDSSDLHLIQKENTTSAGNAGSPLNLPNGVKAPPTYERTDSNPGNNGNTVADPPKKTTYIIEVLAVVDYRIYQQMYDLSTESTEEDKAEDTIDRIKQYYGQVINGVDMRYRSINVPTMSINVHFAGCYIAQDPDSSPFIERTRVRTGSSIYVPAVLALGYFSEWINQNRAKLPRHDQASLYALDPLNGASGDKISGLAYYRSLNSTWAQLICRHASLYAVAEVTAHEIGHNMGGVHDGIDNACRAADQHIMVASSAPLTNATYKNAYTFSNCSISEFASFLQTLPPYNALTTQSDSSPVPELPTPLGVLYSPDAQCAIIYGNGSFYCSGSNEDRQICRTMSCYHPVWQYCVTTYDQRAFPGTQCGNKMWCYMGDCVSNDKAPEIPSSASADCLYGDSRVPFYDGFQCSSVSSQPWKCYQQSVASSCCRSCKKVMDSSMLGCEYGNRYAGCDDYRTLDCKDPTIKGACCKSCADIGSVQGSKYSTTTSASTAPTTTSTTTTTTTTTTTPTTTTMRSTTKTSGPGCIDAFGTWCRYRSNFPPSYCYTQNQIYCCAFCASIRDDSRPGCEYGDRFTWCDASRCSNPSERQSCCGSCRNELLIGSNATNTMTPTTIMSTPTTTSTTKTSTTKATTPTTTTTTTSTSTRPTTTTPTTTTSTTTSTTRSTTTSTATTSTSTTRTSTTTTSTTTTTTTVAPGRATKTSAPGTVCTDNKSICTGIDRSQCYSITIQNACCLTCRNFRIGLPGCEYGDQYPILCATVSRSNCDYYRAECCRTCSLSVG